jgi:hypothetical protein
VDLDEDFIVLGNRSLNLFEVENVRPPVLLVDDGPTT